jgi:hypothetical protein
MRLRDWHAFARAELSDGNKVAAIETIAEISFCRSATRRPVDEGAS